MWSGGGLFIELMIHQMDECFWIKDAWPVSAHGVGGRIPGSTDCGQNLDSYAVEFTFPDGTKAEVVNRCITNCYTDFATYVHGTKCAAQFSGNIHAPTTHIYKDQRTERSNLAWRRAEGNRQPVAGGVGRAAERDPQQQAAQRDQARRPVEPRLDHGPGRGAYGQDHHLGGSDGLQLPVLRQRG